MITDNSLYTSVIMSIIYSVAIAFVIVVAIFRPSILGNRGEAKVCSILSKLPESDYIVRNDILLKTGRGTSQIDHVVVSVYGIFVIETKNISGWILGDQYGDEWVKNVYGNKYRFRNPLKQNYGHVKALERALELPFSIFIPIVVFSRRARLKIETKQAVIYPDKLLETIAEYQQPLLTTNEINSIAQKIDELTITSRENKKEHVDNIRRTAIECERKINSGICPKCNGRLVLRTGKYGKFYGCSNYPTCRFTKQI